MNINFPLGDFMSDKKIDFDQLAKDLNSGMKPSEIEAKYHISADQMRDLKEKQAKNWKAE